MVMHGAMGRHGKLEKLEKLEWKSWSGGLLGGLTAAGAPVVMVMVMENSHRHAEA